MFNPLRSLVISAVAALFAASCVSAPTETQEKPAADSSVHLRTSLDWEDRFSAVDSFVVVFYDDPYMEDSLRYTRFYKQVSLTGDSNMQVVFQQLKEVVHQREYLKGCRSEGKIWCFEKGSIRQTLYFNTSAQNCTYVYFIKDGNFFYSMPDAAIRKWLEDCKPLARKPEGSVE